MATWMRYKNIEDCKLILQAMLSSSVKKKHVSFFRKKCFLVEIELFFFLGLID